MKKIRKYLVMMLMAFATTLGASAYDFKVDGICYEKWSEKEVYVTYPDAGKKYSGVINIPSYIDIDGHVYSVTSIGWNAFFGCTLLTAVTMPDTVLKIGKSAFSGCSALMAVKLSNSLLKIESNAFSGCTNLLALTLPKSIVYIGENAFEGCPFEKNIPTF